MQRKTTEIALWVAAVWLAAQTPSLAVDQYFQEYLKTDSGNHLRRLELINKSLALSSDRDNFQAYKAKAAELAALGKGEEALTALDKYSEYVSVFFNEWCDRGNKSFADPDESQHCRELQNNCMLMKADAQAERTRILYDLTRYADALHEWGAMCATKDVLMDRLEKPHCDEQYLLGKGEIEVKFGNRPDVSEALSKYVTYRQSHLTPGTDRNQALVPVLVRSILLDKIANFDEEIGALDSVISSWGDENLPVSINDSYFSGGDGIGLFHQSVRLPEAILMRARVKAKAGKAADALADYNLVIDKFGTAPDAASYYLDRAQYYEDHSDVANAQKDYDQAVAKSADSATLCKRAAFLERRKKTKLAQADYEAAAKPTDADSYIPLIGFYQRTGQSDKAHETLERAVQVTLTVPNSGVAPLLLRASVNSAAGRTDDAFKDLASALDASATQKTMQFRARLQRAALYTESADYGQANADIDAAVQIIPDCPSIFAARAKIAEKQGNQPEANKLYTQACSKPVHVLPGDDLAIADAATALDNLQLAKQELFVVLRDPDSLDFQTLSNALLQRAAIYQRLTENARVLEDVEKAVTVNPDCRKEARIIKNKVLVAMGRQPEPEPVVVVQHPASSVTKDTNGTSDKKAQAIKSELTSAKTTGAVSSSTQSSAQAVSNASSTKAQSPVVAKINEQALSALGERNYVLAIQLLESALSVEPANAATKRNLSIAYNGLGQTQLQIDRDGALKYFAKAKELWPDNPMVPANVSQAQKMFASTTAGTSASSVVPPTQTISAAAPAQNAFGNSTSSAVGGAYTVSSASTTATQNSIATGTTNVSSVMPAANANSSTSLTQVSRNTPSISNSTQDTASRSTNTDSTASVAASSGDDKTRLRANVRYKLGLDAENEGKKDLAIIYFKKSCEIFPDLYDAHYHLAKLYREKPDNANALTQLKECSRINPNAADVKQQIAELERSTNQ